MHTFEGGQLKFDYDSSKKKLNVSTQDVHYVAYNKCANEDFVSKWIKDNSQEFGLSLISKSQSMCAVSFDDDSQETLEEALYESHLEYEIL